jgi:hypothetical protein
VARGRKRTTTAKSFGEFKSSRNRGGLSSISQPGALQSTQALEKERQETRDKFFDGRNVSNDRADRRRIQDDLIKNFIATQMKPVSGSSNLLQKVDPTGMDLSEYRQMVTNQYGPTLGEVGGDIMRGLGSIGSGLGQFIGGGGITGAILKALTGAKDMGKKGLGFLSQMFTRPTDAPMAAYDPGQAIRDAEVLAQAQSGSPTVDAITGETYTDLYGGNRDYSGFLNQVSEDPINIEMSESMPLLFTQPISPSYRIKQAAMDRFSPDYLKMQQDLLDEIKAADRKINTNL